MDKDRIVIDPQSVSKVFKSINTKKATGPDNMSAHLQRSYDQSGIDFSSSP